MIEGDRGASDSSKWSLGSLERRASERGGFTAAADANWNPGRAKWTDTARLTQCKRACAPRRHAQDMLVTDTHQPAVDVPAIWADSGGQSGNDVID